MGITNILLLVLGYVLLLFSTKLVNGGGISIMRKGPTSDAQERIFSWFALSLMPFLSIAISGGVLGLGNMVFTAALTAGVLQLLLIYGMLGITGTYRLAGNALRDLVLLLVCVVILIVCTNYTWSKGHPASTISRGMGLFLCVLAVAFTVWMLPYFMGKNRKLQRRPDTDFVPAIVFTLVGLALAGLGGAVQILGNAMHIAQFAGQEGFGFQGITVALIASSNPIGCIFAGLFYGAMKYGGSKLNLVGAPKEVLDIIMGAIVLVIAISHVFKTFAQKKMQKGGK